MQTGFIYLSQRRWKVLHYTERERESKEERQRESERDANTHFERLNPLFPSHKPFLPAWMSAILFQSSEGQIKTVFEECETAEIFLRTSSKG